MKKAYLIILATVILLCLITTQSLWKLKAQEPEPPPVQAEVTQEFTPDLEQESDMEFVQSMNLLEDSELLEMLISDPDFPDVLEEFGEDIGIEEEEVPLELLGESEIFSLQMGEMGKSGEALEMKKEGR